MRRWRRILRRGGFATLAVAASLVSGLLIAADILMEGPDRPARVAPDRPASTPTAPPPSATPAPPVAARVASVPALPPPPAVAMRTETLLPPHDVRDGLTILNGDKSYRLSGLEGPARDAICLDRDRLLWACGLSARAALSNLIRNQTLTCRGPAPARGADPLVTCTGGDGVELARALVSAGLARPADGSFAAELAAARQAARGLWNGGWAIRP